jgi:hypothetical protein
MADTSFEFIGEPFDKPATAAGVGASGTQGPKGGDGKSHYDGGSCQYVCDTAPTNGQPGLAPTSAADTGSPGAKGRPSPGGVLKLGLVTGKVTILMGGSDGQKGGKGGKGGPGGPGGFAGTSAQGCKDAGQGPQGPGGKGGDGGQGGDGGDSGFLTIYYTDGGGTVTVKTTGVAGGDGGDPGDPGDGVGNLGAGKPGKPGNPGPPPKFSMNKT